MIEDTAKYKLDWTAFRRLSGDDRLNFECLCRTLVKSCFGGIGELFERRNLEGIEFGLRTTKRSQAFGASGTVVGWQCKCFDHYLADGRLSASAKKQIADSLAKTSHDVSIWYLCLQHKPYAEDYVFLKELEATHQNVTIRVWSECDYIEMMDIIAEGPWIRRAYFGDWAVTDEWLALALDKASAGIRHRWPEGLYVATRADESISRALLSPKGWRMELGQINEIRKFVDAWDALVQDKEAEWHEVKTQVNWCFENLLSPCASEVKDDVMACIDSTLEVLARLYHRLKRSRSNKTFSLYNVMAGLNRLRKIRDAVRNETREKLIAVVSDAGFGKTCLSLSVVFPVQDGADRCVRPAGVLFQGNMLAKGDGMDELARRYGTGGCSFGSMEELLFVVDAAAKRHRCCLPIVVDGLNEAERPGDWKDILVGLKHLVLTKFGNLLVVVTLRTGEVSTSIWKRPSDRSAERRRYVDISLPDNTRLVYIPPLGVFEIAKRYFEFYKIGVDRFALPPVLRHPLAIRYYCECENPDRKDFCVPESIPEELTGVFEKRMRHMATNVARNLTSGGSETTEDVLRDIWLIGRVFWNARSRSVDEGVLEQEMTGGSSRWANSRTRLFVEEGLLLLDQPDEECDHRRCKIAYDALAGFLIAYYLFHSHVSLDDGADHPLISDIVMAYVSLWSSERSDYVGEHVPEWVIPLLPRCFIRLAKGHVSSRMIGEVLSAGLKDPELRKECFEKVVSSIGQVNLLWNGGFLDKLLSRFSLAERDLSWGRWVYDQRVSIWSMISSRLEEYDESTCFVLKWLLSSNVREIRDRATRRLVEIGKKYPLLMFEFISNNLTENDPYVGERLLAVGYGVSLSLPDRNLIGTYARKVKGLMDDGKVPLLARHYLALDYILSTLSLVQSVSPVVILPRKNGGMGTYDKDILSQVDPALGMDFKAYALTRLVGAMPYQMDGSDYLSLELRIKQRIATMGYRWNLFKDIDWGISEYRWSESLEQDDGLHIERFGHKYCMIAYLNELAEHTGDGIPERQREYSDIDPTFPTAPGPIPAAEQLVLDTNSLDDATWLKQGVPDDISRFLVREFDEADGEWVLLWGHYETTEGSLRQLRVSETTVFSTNPNERVQFGDIPEHYYVFYGEIPLRDDHASVRTPYVDYTWGSFYSPEHEGCGAIMPSARFLREMELSLVDGNWQTVDCNGRIATRYYNHGLYARKDLVLGFAARHHVQARQIVSGERNLREDDSEISGIKAYSEFRFVKQIL